MMVALLVAAGCCPYNLICRVMVTIATITTITTIAAIATSAIH